MEKENLYSSEIQILCCNIENFKSNNLERFKYLIWEYWILLKRPYASVNLVNGCYYHPKYTFEKAKQSLGKIIIPSHTHKKEQTYPYPIVERKDSSGERYLNGAIHEKRGLPYRTRNNTYIHLTFNTFFF